MPPTLLLIHHSHTDIGYTDPQAVIARWHADYVRAALDLAERDPDFAWQCETFWGVERFWEAANPGDRVRFVQAVRAGRIGLSASWANLNELADQPLLDHLAQRARRFAADHGVPLRSAMTADINGHGWGLATALLDAGVQNLFACVHTHHGRYPLDRPQQGFWWEAPDGRRLLVWSGEHYHLGNELGLAPGAVSSYLTKDECDARTIFHEPWTVATRRIPRYLARLEAAGPVPDAIPVMISGLRTDNGPPSQAIADMARRWNAEHGDVCRVAMGTLDDVFAGLRRSLADRLPIHRGDWPDWWSDGLASEPVATRLFRQAQREWAWLRRRGAAPAALAAIADQLAHYAEHTFGHSDSLTAPWHELVHRIGARKRAHAAVACDLTAAALDAADRTLGGGPPATGRPLRYRVVHDLDRPVAGVAALVVEHTELCERDLDGPVRVQDATGVRLPVQRRPVPRGVAFDVAVTVPPGEGRWLDLVAVADDEARGGGEAGPGDVLPAGPGAGSEPAGVLTAAPATRLAWQAGAGITGLEAEGRSLLLPGAAWPAFALITERTPAGPAPGDQAAVRAAMGLNRKGPDEVRHPARCTGGTRLADGTVCVRQQLHYETVGGTVELELALYRTRPVLAAALRLHHAGTRDPENLYLPLPLTWPGADTLWAFKAGAAVRPWRDQIPDTVADWTCVQEGFARCGPDGGVVIATLDSPLLWLGPLASGRRRLMGDPSLPAVPEHAFAWLANNFWETNFRAEVGGCHEWRFAVSWGADLGDPVAARRRAEELGSGLRAVRQAV